MQLIVPLVTLSDTCIILASNRNGNQQSRTATEFAGGENRGARNLPEDFFIRSDALSESRTCVGLQQTYLQQTLCHALASRRRANPKYNYFSTGENRQVSRYFMPSHWPRVCGPGTWAGVWLIAENRTSPPPSMRVWHGPLFYSITNKNLLMPNS